LAALLFFFAFGYRLIGIGWGLPNDLHNQSYHPDELLTWEYSQQIHPSQLQFAPGSYNYGTFYLSLLRIASDMTATYSGAPDKNDIKSTWAYIGRCHLAGRVISALAGAGTAVVVFLFLRRFTRLLGAFGGGLLIAVAPGFVVHSRFQAVDVLATFLLALSTYYSVLLIPSERQPRGDEDWKKKAIKYAVLAGLFAGLSAGTKYTGILALFTLYAACAMSLRKDSVMLAGLGTLTAIVAFVGSTPGIIIDNKNFMRDFRYEMLHTETGHGLLFTDVGSGFTYQLNNLMIGIGALLGILAVIGCIFGVIQKQKWIWALMAFAIPYYILIGRAEVMFLRYTFPLYIVLAAGFAWWMGYAHEKQGWHRLAVLMGIFGLGASAQLSANYTTAMSGVDERDAVASKLKGMAAAKPDTQVGFVSDPWYWSPPLIPDAGMLRGIANYNRFILPEMQASKAPRVVQYLPPDISQRFDWDTRLLTETKPEYVVFSNYEVGDVSRLTDATNLKSDDKLLVDRFKAFDSLLRKSYVNLQPGTPEGQQDAYAAAHALVNDMEYVRPILWIWKRKDLP